MVSFNHCQPVWARSVGVMGSTHHLQPLNMDTHTLWSQRLFKYPRPSRKAHINQKLLAMNHKPIIWKTSVLGNCWGMQVILLKFSMALGTTQNEKVKWVELCTKVASPQCCCLGALVSPGDKHSKLLTRLDLRWAHRVTGSWMVKSSS